MPELPPEEQERLVKRHVDALMEYFEVVQIMVSSNVPEGTSNVFKGDGNWFARQGMAHDFIRQDKARTDAREISKAIEPPKDAGEEWKIP